MSFNRCHERPQGESTIRKIAVCVVALALVGWLSVTVAAADKSDFALLSGPGGDTSVQCGATKAELKLGVLTFKPTSFVVHITMTNRTDNAGTAGFVRVNYLQSDGVTVDDLVDYAIGALGTVQISLSGGGTPGSDQIIQVVATSGANLVGQISLITEDGKPHPNLPNQAGVPPGNYCTTSP